LADELTIHNAHLKELPKIVEFVTSSVEKQGLHNITFQIESAVDEACTNVINYAYDGKPGYISLSVAREDNTAVITINDKGKQFDPNSIAVPDTRSDIFDRSIGGLGIYIMKKLMDEIIYHYDPKTGNTLILKKKDTGLE
jgi:anti-sigma regulatory factor (Ser/Thr protein kinase)